MPMKHPLRERARSQAAGALALLLALLTPACAGGARYAADGSWQGPREADVPAGFPAPSEPGVVEVKQYPAMRAAWTEVDGSFDSGSNRGFFPLFRHIKRRGIEMTAPVVVDYPAEVEETNRGRMAMAFLYPDEGTGTPGADGRRVEVKDSEPVTVVSVGVDGPYTLRTMRPALETLEAWLVEHAAEYERAGPPRRLMYQQPLPFKRLYSEVQIPVRAAQAP